MTFKPSAVSTTSDLHAVFTNGTAASFARWMRSVPRAADRQRQLLKLSTAEAGRLGEIASTDQLVDLLESVDTALSADLIAAFAPDDAVRVVDALDSDEVARMLREVDHNKRESLLAVLPVDRANQLRGLLSWPPHSAAAQMVPDVLRVPPHLTAAEAIAAVRDDAVLLRTDSRTGAYIYVTDADSHLLGVIAFRDLVLADPQMPVSALMNDDYLAVSPLTDDEDVAAALSEFNLVAVPVIDADRRLLGIITEDDAADIAEQEATEDAERQGGSAPLDVPYLRASPLLLWRKRIVWLLLLFVAEAYTGTVLRAFEEELDAVVALAFFIPLLIGTGGNTGTQITTTLVRALATGQVRLQDVPAVLAKELSTSMLIALTMGLAAVVRAWTLGVGPQVTVTVALSVAAIVVWAAFVASILPPLLKKLRLDPALVSAPAIATIVDGTGLLIYFMIAHATLPQLQGL